MAGTYEYWQKEPATPVAHTAPLRRRVGAGVGVLGAGVGAGVGELEVPGSNGLHVGDAVTTVVGGPVRQCRRGLGLLPGMGPKPGAQPKHQPYAVLVWSQPGRHTQCP